MEYEVGEVVGEGRYRLRDEAAESVKKDEPQRLKPGDLTALRALLKSCPDKAWRNERYGNKHGKQL
jgi:hypothetical protein